jgi:spore coat polysaccharide biosynthesis protein SpsF
MHPIVIAVVTARMGSERLPGKVMLPLAGKPVVAHIVERLGRVQGIDAVWLGTSSSPENAPLIDLARSLGIEAYAGSEEDVVERHVAIAERSGADHLVRASADCPLFGTELASRLVAHHVTTCADFTYVPAILSVGILTEVISARAMQRVHEIYQGEHITLPIKERPEAFRIEPLEVGATLDERLYRPEFRLTLDEPADYDVLRAIYDALYREGKPPELSRVMEFLQVNPEIAALNAHVRQKAGNLYAQELDARVLAVQRKGASHAPSVPAARDEKGKRG